MRKDTEGPVELCLGAETRPQKTDAETEKNRTILFKAAVVCLLTSGSVGFYLSAISVTYNPFMFNTAVVLIGLYFSYFYRTRRRENLGAFLFFIAFAAFVIFFRDYVNSGFYAVINRTASRMSDYFNTTGMKTYTERIADRNLTVTAFAIVWAAALEFFLMSAVVIRAGYILTTVLTMALNLLPIYMKLEPSPVYAAELASGLFMTFMIRSSGHYRLSRSKSGYEKTKRGFTYGNDLTVLTETALIFGVLIFGFALSSGAGAASYDEGMIKSPMKKSGEESVKNAMLLGFDGIFNRYPSTGGLSSGRLGGVSQLRNDNQPDLDVTFTPYTQQRIYLRGFAFDKYNPKANYWSVSDASDSESVSSETASLKKKYNDHEDGSARGIMRIENKGAPEGNYLPYYSTENGTSVSDKSEVVTYYPLTDKGKLTTGKHTADKKYLSVPDADRESIEKFCEKAGLYKAMDADAAIKILTAYFQKNYPYTLKPGATPQGEDFVDYFLDTNKKGYCAHFASAATLILRYLGIPARYCEGYVIDFERITETADAENDLKYSDYYDGYNELGQTGVVKASVPDASAHAWVEVYDTSEGWKIADVTPSSSDTENGGGILSALYDLFSGGSSNSDSTQQADDSGNDSGGSRVFSAGAGSLRIFFIVIIMLLLSPVVIALVKKLAAELAYRRVFASADNSGKLVIWFSHQTEKINDPDFSSKINYREQVSYLLGNSAENEPKAVTDVLDRADFSDKTITEDEYEKTRAILERAIKDVKSFSRRGRGSNKKQYSKKHRLGKRGI